MAKITTAAGRVTRDFGVEPPSVNRSIYFPAFVFLLLFALLLLLSGQLSRFSVPRSMLESGKARDRAVVEKATLTNPQAVAMRDLQSDLSPVLIEIRRHLSFFGLFPHPVEINVSENEERVVSFVDAALNKITRKLRGVQIHLKNHVHSSFNLKIVSRYRTAVNLVTRIHSRPMAFYQLGLADKIGAFVPYRQSIGGAGLFVHKDALATRTNGRSRKKIRSDSQRLERQLARFSRSMWRRGSLRTRTVNAKIQSESLNGFFATEAIIGTTNCGRVFFGTSLAGPVSRQKLLQPFNRLSPGRQRVAGAPLVNSHK
jgi:hypothetical protein